MAFVNTPAHMHVSVTTEQEQTDFAADTEPQSTVENADRSLNSESQDIFAKDENVVVNDDITIDESIYDLNTDIYETPVEQDSYINSNDNKNNTTVLEAVLSPIGWAIGGVIAPIYIGVDFTGKSVAWSGEHIVAPIGKGIAKGVYYASLPVINSIEWSIDNVVSPTVKGVGWSIETTAKGIYWGIDKTFDYAIIPTAKGIYCGMGKTFDYTIVPTVQALAWTVDKGFEYVIEPTVNGIYWTVEKGFEYTVVHNAEGLFWGAEKTYDYVLLPAAKGVYYSADFGFDYIVAPF